MNPYEMFQTDKALEFDKGVVIDYGDFRVTIARAGGANKKFSKVLNARLAPYRRQVDTGTLDEAVATKIMIETYADSIILNFDVKKETEKDGKTVVEYVQGIPDPDGDIQPFDRDNVIRIFSELPDLFRDIQAQADKIALFRVSEIEAISKNS